MSKDNGRTAKSTGSPLCAWPGCRRHRLIYPRLTKYCAPCTKAIGDLARRWGVAKHLPVWGEMSEPQPWSLCPRGELDEGTTAQQLGEVTCADCKALEAKSSHPRLI